MRKIHALAMAFVLVVAPGAYAQISTGNIYGTVVDESFHGEPDRCTAAGVAVDTAQLMRAGSEIQDEWRCSCPRIAPVDKPVRRTIVRRSDLEMDAFPRCRQVRARFRTDDPQRRCCGS